MNDRLRALSDAGISVWLDDISRDRIQSGNLRELIDEYHVVGVTSNPSIFANALGKSALYADQLAELKGAGKNVDEIITTVTTDDIRNACDIFRPLYDETNGENGRVSIEVDPRLAHDLDTTIEQAKQLHSIVGRENVLIKIPATAEGLKAITATIGAGISVNVTLIFSVERYGEVLEAYSAGLEQARAAGLDLSKIHSVASVFVSRVDTEIDKRLEAIGSEEALSLRGRAGLANSRLCYELYEQTLQSDRWKALAEAGAHPQRPLWASTGVKNPDYQDTMYVTELVADNCVNTMPEATLMAFADHGEVKGDTITGRYEEARSLVADLERVGIDFNDVFKVLEDEGVQKFIDSWVGLIDATTQKVDSI